MEKGQFFWLQPPYARLETWTEEAQEDPTLTPGACLVWRLGLADTPRRAEQARTRPAGVPLVVMLPPSSSVLDQDVVLDVVERCRPQSILPHHPRIEIEEVVTLLRRPPDDLPGDVTEYLRWRGYAIDLEMRRTVRRIIELSSDVRTVSALARGLYVSRRALGRRFLSLGLPAPSHWLQIGRLLRATIQLQNAPDNLFSIACGLGYPDGFALSNQMKRLTGVRPSTARDALGWEWFFEAWLQQERQTGSLTHPVSLVGQH